MAKFTFISIILLDYAAHNNFKYHTSALGATSF